MESTINNSIFLLEEFSCSILAFFYFLSIPVDFLWIFAAPSPLGSVQILQKHFKQQEKLSREFEHAALPVEGEILDADGAGRAEDGGR